MSGRCALWRVWIFALVAAAVVAGTAAAAQEAPEAAVEPPELKPTTVQAVLLSSRPAVDGRLDDPAWGEASHFEGFWRNDVGLFETERTEGWVGCTRDAIYFALYCHDSQPDQIRGVVRQRGAYFGADDSVTVVLDVRHDRRDTFFYRFRINARGTQSDVIPGGNAAKIEWRGDWRTAAQRVADGWTVEIEIPFEVLKYPKGQTCFGFNLARHISRRDEWVGWPYLGKVWAPEYMADLVGLALPEPVRRPLVMTYGVVEGGEDTDTDADAGLDVKHTFESGVTGVLTANPDFRNIEDVVESISFTYTERYLAERRPFLVEGDDFIRATYRGYRPYPNGLYYTRRIGDVDLGLKAFGQVGDHRFGVLDAAKFGRGNDLVASYQRELPARAEARITLVDHRSDVDADATDVGLDLYQHRVLESDRISYFGEFYRSGVGGDRGTGSHWRVGGGLNRGDRRVSFGWWYEHTASGFDPALGYVPDRGMRGGWIGPEYAARLDAHGMEQLYAGVDVSYFGRDSGGMLERSVNPWVSVDLANGTAVSASYNAFKREGQDGSGGGVSYSWNRRDVDRRGSIYLNRGKRVGGAYTYVGLDQAFAPSDDMELLVTGEYARLAEPAPEPFDRYQIVADMTYHITDEREASARLLGRDEGLSAYAAYRQALRRGTDVFLLLGEPDPSVTGFKGRVALKVVRTF